MTTPQRKPISIDSYGDSHQGRCRDTNDDQYMIAQLNRSLRIDCASLSELEHKRKYGDDQGCLLLVADGVSGATEAEEASEAALETVVEHALNGIGWNPDLDLDAEVKLRKELRETVEHCDERVTNMVNGHAADDAPATTLTMALVRWPHLFIAHVGDSRAYLIRNQGSEVKQLTTDHTLAEKLVEKGEIAREEVPQSPLRRMLWNAVGASDEVNPELLSEKLRPGDAVFLCTDGVSRNITDRTLRTVFAESATAEQAARKVLNIARSVDDADNMTVAVARFRDEVVQPAPMIPPVTGWRPDSASATATEAAVAAT